MPDRQVKEALQERRERRLQTRRTAARWATITAVTLVLVVLMLDVLGGPGVKYVGILAAAPFLAAVFDRARSVVLVGVLTLALAALYGVYQGVGDDSAQWLRLAAIAISTCLAAGSARVRRRVDEQLGAVSDVAETAQRALLRTPERVDGLDVAVRYLSAQAESRIGGDLYEIVETEHGVRALMGDVRGKGLGAVRLGNDVLGAFRYLAHTEGDLHRVVRELDGVVARAGESEDFVTAVLLEIKDGDVTILNCGHPDPLVVTAAGVQELVTTEASLPLGLGADPRGETLQLGHGERLFLYTDGLVEARSKEGEFFDLVGEARALRAASLELGLDELFVALKKHSELDDDVAAMVLLRR